MEEWKNIKNYGSKYRVYPDGRVYRKRQNRDEWVECVCRVGSHGYKQVSLYAKGKTHARPVVHRVVAQVFIPNPDNLETVNHKDFDKTNNNVSNLEWMSMVDNRNHALDADRFVYHYGSKNGKSKLKEMQVLTILALLPFKSDHELADVYNVKHQSVYAIRKGISWGWLTGIQII